MTLIRRKRDDLYIATIVGWDGPDGRPGYRHIVHALKADLALRFTEAAAAKICDFNFEGKPYSPKGYNVTSREPEYERVDILPFDRLRVVRRSNHNLKGPDNHASKAIRTEAGSGS